MFYKSYEFLKKWLVHTSEKPITSEQIEAEYDMYSKSLRWQLIENSILKSFNLKVDSNEVEDYTKKLISRQMSQYGQPNVIPYLIRRAEENTSIAGQMGRELTNISIEKKRRKNI